MTCIVVVRNRPCSPFIGIHECVANLGNVIIHVNGHDLIYAIILLRTGDGRRLRPRRAATARLRPPPATTHPATACPEHRARGPQRAPGANTFRAAAAHAIRRSAETISMI